MRVISLIDLDAFYAQVEEMRLPHYHGFPIGVQQQTLVVTTNYIARARGVKKLISANEARKICPEIVLIPSNMNRYRLASAKILAHFRKYCSLIQRSSIDEMFLDITKLVDTFFFIYPEYSLNIPQSDA